MQKEISYRFYLGCKGKQVGGIVELLLCRHTSYIGLHWRRTLVRHYFIEPGANVICGTCQGLTGFVDVALSCQKVLTSFSSSSKTVCVALALN
jgi:hypothetical protein